MAGADNPVVLGIAPTSASEQERIRAVDPKLEFIDAGGWFDGEIRATWPAYNSERYLRPESTGTGSRAERDALLARADIILGGWPYPLDLRARAPRLRWFHQRPAGASNLRRGDLWASDVTVTTSRGFSNSRAIAEYAIAGIMHFAKGFDQAGEDAQRRAFDPQSYRPSGFADKQACVVGVGGIGLEVARLCAGLGMKVVGTRSREPDAASRAVSEAAGFSEIGGPESLYGYLPETDFLIIACQWTPATSNLVCEPLLQVLKPGAVLVNIARGEIVNESDLLGALDGDRLRGAVLDVYVGEFEGPPPEPLWSHPRVLLTPHTSAMSDQPGRRNIEIFLSNLRSYLGGRALENVIDWERGY
ncbi:MAG: D-2-hydroxyacid dehydrogenase [Gammaproteobacteria bacterium]|nr:D-2-hydroxyacid dehydrogenase [Gammaproteobacteria bacterium]